jgi:mRNA-degrading endonuclease toxin of MazEF toxin-antitoxin module
MMAGMLAPLTPKLNREATGYGTAATCDGLATRLQKNCTMQMPTIRQMKTCQLVRPSANRLPAVT